MWAKRKSIKHKNENHLKQLLKKINKNKRKLSGAEFESIGKPENCVIERQGSIVVV